MTLPTDPTTPASGATVPTHVRVEVPLAADERDVGAARLWAAGAIGVWERPDGLTAWFDRPDPTVPAGATVTVEPDRDWQAAWKATIAPVRAGRFLVVPTWLADEHRDGDPRFRLVLDPGAAFGSGHHATTTLCLEVLDRDAQDGRLVGRRVADVGCGSGILAIAAARLGAAEVDAVDIDPDAVAVTARNAAANGVELLPRVGSVDALEGPADVVVANLLTDVLVTLAPKLVAACRDRLVVSGVASERGQRIADALTDAGATPIERRDRDGWACLVAEVGP